MRKFEKMYNMLNEEFIDAVKQQGDYIEIFKNPNQSELNSLNSARGWIAPNGDLYVVKKDRRVGQEYLIHYDIIKILYSKKIQTTFNPKNEESYYETMEYQSPDMMGISVQFGKGNNLYIAESYTQGHFKNNYYSVFEKIWKTSKKKNPGINFHDVKI